MSAANRSSEWQNDPRREDFVEQFGVLRELSGSTRMEGRVLAYLMISDKPYVSASELARELQASAGSISTTCRRLMELGFIVRRSIPGDRNHYYGVDDDIWGSFLAGERLYLDRQRRLFDDMLEKLPGELDGPRRRLQNARNYMVWLASYHKKMLAEWDAYKSTLGEDRAAKGEDD
jgi:DNA-binding transcriptional regulator GbsR (MarR family)